MSIINKNFKLLQNIPDMLPKEWFKHFDTHKVLLFRNLDDFIFNVSKLTQIQDGLCGVTYKEALDDLIRGKTQFTIEDQESIRNLVRSNLFKRGLITNEVYESFKYTADGVNLGVDIGKYASGESECIITPSVAYIDHFYELYVNVSYSYNVKNEAIKENIAKLLATIEELERKHVFIKVSIVLPICGVNTDNENFFSLLPLFSHKDVKSVSKMSAVLNEKLLRKFYFAVLEDIYSKDLRPSYGTVKKLDKTINIGETLNEIELFETLYNEAHL